MLEAVLAVERARANAERARADALSAERDRLREAYRQLFILHDDTTPALDLLHEYRTRQHHEQGHRIGVHDLWIDASPSGYPKSSRPDRPGFSQGPLTLCAWIAAIASDALRALGDALPARFHLAHPRTLRHWVLMRDTDMIVTPSHMLVVLAFTKRRAWLRPVLQRFNKAEAALPWLGGRHVVMGFVARGQPVSDARPVLPEVVEVGSGSAKGCGSVWCYHPKKATSRKATQAPELLGVRTRR